MATKKNTPKKSAPKKTVKKKAQILATKKDVIFAEDGIYQVGVESKPEVAMYTAEYVRLQRNDGYEVGRSAAADDHFIWGVVVSSVAWACVDVIVWVLHG